MNATSNHSFVNNRFWTGTRPSEAIALRCGDVDLSNRRIRIQRSRVLGAPAAVNSSCEESMAVAGVAAGRIFDAQAASRLRTSGVSHPPPCGPLGRGPAKAASGCYSSQSKVRVTAFFQYL